MYAMETEFKRMFLHFGSVGWKENTNIFHYVTQIFRVNHGNLYIANPDSHTHEHTLLPQKWKCWLRVISMFIYGSIVVVVERWRGLRSSLQTIFLVQCWRKCVTGPLITRHDFLHTHTICLRPFFFQSLTPGDAWTHSVYCREPHRQLTVRQRALERECWVTPVLLLNASGH